MEIMKKHTCKLCSRRFSNGRALGGHMRSHVVSAGAAAATASTSSADDQIPSLASAPVSVSYVLRENPKRSVKLSDPEYLSSSAYLVHPADHGESSIVQDQESDVESSPRAARRRQRSKRRKHASPPPPPLDIEQPASSVSDATTEEDVAMSLIMLSRDTWINPVIPDLEPTSDAEPDKGCSKARARFECNTCKKVFKSYQALGGHRAGFKNGKARCAGSLSSDEKPGTVPIHGFVPDSAINDNVDGSFCKPGGTHPCPFCPKVFDSGQALGGHKKSHQKGFAEYIGTGNLSDANGGGTSVPASSSSSPVGFIDLNLPAPAEDEFEMSAVYDGEFDQIKMACN